MRHFPRIPFALASALLVMSFTAQAVAAAPQVVVEVVQAVDLPLQLEYPGRTAGYREVEVRAQVGGILQERTYQEGSNVTKGQVLFRIDPLPYQAALARAKGSLAQEQARLRQTQRDLSRVRELASKGYASGSELDNSISAYEQSKANVQVAEAEVHSRQIDLDYTTVKAPISGITSREARSEGSLMVATDPGASLLTQLTQLDPIYVNFAPPADSESARLRSSLKDGSLSLVEGNEVSVEVILSDGSVYPQKGRVDFTDSLIDKATGTVSSRAVLPNAHQRLLPGQFVRVRITGIVRNNAMSLPERAIAQGPRGTYVYVVDADGLARKRQVVLGHTTGGRWMIDSGLAGGEQVVVEGLQRVKADQPVQISQVIDNPQKGFVEEVSR